MARQSGLHDRTFKRRFRQATGYSPIDYVHALRVEEAKHLLETTRISVEAMATKIGYADPAHFSRLFCRLAGITPAKWRRCYGTDAVPHHRIVTAGQLVQATSRLMPKRSGRLIPAFHRSSSCSDAACHSCFLP
ncbi:helix-turn-helix domain-containing protein [Paracoccus alkanivorans]|uniref:helix-turn-helix domain-containing protein n=1 Tax=Paracoccus alkanivorans TaxID=2116655 RepID=UPI003C7BACF9